MGKAARQRRLRRMKFLADLAKEDSSRFDMEWERRLSSWLEQIRKDAGILRNAEGRSVVAVFEYVQEAIALLSLCGQEVFEKYGESSWEVLTNECCRSLARRVDPSLFRLSKYREVREPG
jgi:hypothetical protein